MVDIKTHGLLHRLVRRLIEAGYRLDCLHNEEWILEDCRAPGQAALVLAMYGPAVVYATSDDRNGVHIGHVELTWAKPGELAMINYTTTLDHVLEKHFPGTLLTA